MPLVSTEPASGEVWVVDFGLAAKQRPVLVLAYPQPEDARALVVVVPLTSQVRNAPGGSLHWKTPMVEQAIGYQCPRICQH